MGNNQTTDAHEDFEEVHLTRPTREQVDATFEQLVVSPKREREREAFFPFFTPLHIKL